MAITNKKTLEKMKKKNLKSIRVDKDGKVTNAGKKPSKKGGSIFESPRSKAIRLSTESGKANTAATSKMYAAESMFNTAKARDEAKVKPGKARSFKEAFDAATKAGKERFMVEGKSYLTTKGKRKDRFDPTKIKAADKKLNIFQKFNRKMRGTNPDGSTGTQAGYEAARDKRRIEKRIANIKKRKNEGKSFSVKNLAELEKKLK